MLASAAHRGGSSLPTMLLPRGFREHPRSRFGAARAPHPRAFASLSRALQGPGSDLLLEAEMSQKRAAGPSGLMDKALAS